VWWTRRPAVPLASLGRGQPQVIRALTASRGRAVARAEGGRTPSRLARGAAARRGGGGARRPRPGWTGVLRGAGAGGAPAGGPAADCQAEGPPSAGSSRRLGRTPERHLVVPPQAGVAARGGREVVPVEGAGGERRGPHCSCRQEVAPCGRRPPRRWCRRSTSPPGGPPDRRGAPRRGRAGAGGPPRPSAAGPGPHPGDGADSVVSARWTSADEAAAPFRAVAGWELPPTSRLAFNDRWTRRGHAPSLRPRRSSGR
jgi:hypothetical protein